MASRARWVLPVQLKLVTDRLRHCILTFVAVLKSRDVWRRRRRGRVKECRQYVCAAEDRRRPSCQGRERQDAALTEQAEPVRIGQLNLAEAVAVDAGDSVMLRQLLVDERVVGAEQLRRG